MKFNMNETVRVRLTPKGLEILKASHDGYKKTFPDAFGEFVPPSTDKDGWSEFQLHELMQTFGSHITMGMQVQPFETNIDLPVKPVNEACGLLGAISMTAHLHKFSEEQAHLISDSYEKLRALL